jgi:Lrp/AsnC family leucine-responsive transcriptional regulator
VIVQVTLDSHSDETLFEFGRALADIPEVLEAYLISGDYDYLIRIAVSDTRDYERLLREKLYKIPGIRHSKSSFVLRSLKQARPAAAAMRCWWGLSPTLSACGTPAWPSTRRAITSPS